MSRNKPGYYYYVDGKRVSEIIWRDVPLSATSCNNGDYRHRPIEVGPFASFTAAKADAIEYLTIERDILTGYIKELRKMRRFGKR